MQNININLDGDELGTRANVSLRHKKLELLSDSKFNINKPAIPRCQIS